MSTPTKESLIDALSDAAEEFDNYEYVYATTSAILAIIRLSHIVDPEDASSHMRAAAHLVLSSADDRQNRVNLGWFEGEKYVTTFWFKKATEYAEKGNYKKALAFIIEGVIRLIEIAEPTNPILCIKFVHYQLMNMADSFEEKTAQKTCE